MAQARASLLTALLLCASAVTTLADERAETLQRMTDESADGVIRLDHYAFSRAAEGKDRPYSLVLICLARHMMDKGNLNLRDLRTQFGRVAALAREEQHGADHKVFFAEVEFTTDKDIFERLQVTMLPLILRVPPTLAVAPGGKLSLKEGDKMTSASFPGYPWTASDIVGFVGARTGLALELPPEPTLAQMWYFPYLLAGGLVGGTALAYGLYCSPFMRWPGLYLTGAMAVYVFSVSGGMYNIIRGMPFMIRKEDGPQLFLQGQGQLGAEGFIMGSRYTGFGLALAAATLLAPRIKSATGQRVLCYTCLLVAFMCLNGVISVYKWKTGYGVRTYLFGE